MVSPARGDRQHGKIIRNSARSARHHGRNPVPTVPRLLQSYISGLLLPPAWASLGNRPRCLRRVLSKVERKGPLDPEGERPGQTGALPRTGATHANARRMAEQDRPIWELDFSLQDLNGSALSRCCSLIPGLGVKLSAIILAGSMVLFAVGPCPPHDGLG
jgi:hypothetical protein